MQHAFRGRYKHCTQNVLAAVDLDDASPFFPYETQVDIVIACCIIHNWVIEDGSDEFNEPDDNDDTQDTIYAGTASENAIMLAFRQGLADQMWADRQSHGN